MDMRNSCSSNEDKDIVFISHSTKDKEIADQVCKLLEEQGIKCFIAPRDIIPGEPYSKAIMDGIDHCSSMVLIASQNAFSSQHVFREIERAVNKNAKIIVYSIDHAQVPKEFEYFIMVNQWIDATKKDQYEEILKAIREGSGYQHTDAPEVNSQSANASNVNASNVNASNINAANSDLTDASDLKKPGKKTNSKYIFYIGGALCIAALGLGIFLTVNSFSNKGNQSGTAKETSVQNLDSTDNKVTTNNQETGNTSDTTSNNLNRDSYKIGDSFEMGKYNGEPIIWQVAEIRKDKSMLVIARDIISLKSFDAAESGKWNQLPDGTTFEHDKESEYTPEQLAAAKGSNDWENSNIRAWLNSDDTKVQYQGSAPDGAGFYDERVRYYKEEGFLKSFTEQELSYIQKTKIPVFANTLNTKKAESGSKSITVENGLFQNLPDFSEQYQYDVTDRVFLLSLEEAKKYLYDSSELKPESKVTSQALEQDQTKEYSSMITSQYEGYYAMLTRTPQPSTADKIMCVFSKDYISNEYYKTYAGTVAGIRPAMVVKFK